jgi:hypothetical protein
MKEAPENGRESSHSAHANGMNECTEHLLLFLFQTTNAQIYITTISLYVTYTPTCFDISVTSGSLTFVPRQVTLILTTEAVKVTVPLNY